jgi:hypothetical protein
MKLFFSSLDFFVSFFIKKKRKTEHGQYNTDITSSAATFKKVEPLFYNNSSYYDNIVGAYKNALSPFRGLG